MVSWRRAPETSVEVGVSRARWELGEAVSYSIARFWMGGGAVAFFSLELMSYDLDESRGFLRRQAVCDCEVGVSTLVCEGSCSLARVGRSVRLGCVGCPAGISGGR